MHYLENKTVFPNGHYKDKHIIELGAGTGLIGLFLAKVGANVVLTDQKSMVPLMEANVNVNDINPSNIKVKELFWYVNYNLKIEGKTLINN